MEYSPYATENGAVDWRDLVMAGPCSVETEEQVLRTAGDLAAMGIGVFRAGIWKPRTKPGGFEGVGVRGLPWLRRVRMETGMLVATEVACRAHVEAALAYDVDILWIGARTSANPFAVQEVADALRQAAVPVHVLVKNPVSPDLELWIGALERLRNAGVDKLSAVFRGFSTYETGIYRNRPIWRVPLELKCRYPDLPLICDPSHIGGKRSLVAPLSQEALDMGFNGLMIECHCDPDNAWSDKDQQITPARLAEILDSLVVRSGVVRSVATGECAGTPDSLTLMRERIDTIDASLIELLARRLEVSKEIGEYKLRHNIPVVQPDRFGEMMADRVRAAEQLGISADFIRRILSTIHEESVRQQVGLSNYNRDEA